MADARLRDVVLDATAFLVQETDRRELTLAAIALHADLDLAAVEAEFPSLEDLGIALSQRMFETFHAAIAAAMGDDDGPQAFTRGMIRAVRDEVERSAIPCVVRALITSLPHRPRLQKVVVAERRAIRLAVLNDGLDPVDALVVLSVLDGLWFATLLEVVDLEPGPRDALFARLEAMLDGGGAALSPGRRPRG